MMQAYINYKVWWMNTRSTLSGSRDEYDFKDHINEMTLHELMEILIDHS